MVLVVVTSLVAVGDKREQLLFVIVGVKEISLGGSQGERKKSWMYDSVQKWRECRFME